MQCRRIKLAVSEKKVLIVGGGAAGLSAAVDLARLGVQVELLEKSSSLGGHAGQLTCKASDACVKCGACVIDEKIQQASLHPGIDVVLDCEVKGVEKADAFSLSFSTGGTAETTAAADAIILATGFDPFSPEGKPYGYGLFDNVVTNLELEKSLRQDNVISRPSDQSVPAAVAFIQCVGSRDTSLNHQWCSEVCCPSSLRLASLIRSKHPETQISVFYIDLQNCGKDFQTFDPLIDAEMKMIRTLPADIFKTGEDRLKVSFFDPIAQKGREDLFDMVVLSVGITPARGNGSLSRLMNIDLADSGFIATPKNNAMTSEKGIFAAGTARGPMSIADSIADAGQAAAEVLKFFRQF
jgi:heterodisulfide reductase subunit A